MANQLDPKRLEGTIAHLYEWCLEQGLLDDQVDAAEVAEIVALYDGVVESEPLPLLVMDEPLLVERRKVFVS